MDMNLVWASDARISLSSRYKELCIPTVAGVSDVSFEGNIRVVLSPLINEPPLFAGVKVAFLFNFVKICKMNKLIVLKKIMKKALF